MGEMHRSAALWLFSRNAISPAALAARRSVTQGAILRPFETSVDWETLEGRRLFSGTVWPAADADPDPQVATALQFARSGVIGNQTAAAVEGVPFDIASFSASLNDAALTTFTSEGLTFISNGARSDGTGSTSFGAGSSPAWTVIGIAAQSGGVQPLLLTYGTTQISYGQNLDNQVSWSDGLFAVMNSSDTSGNDTVSGMFQIVNGQGGFYAQDLLASGGPVGVVSIADGLVTTPTATGYADGQAVQFAGLTGTAGVSNATTYYVTGSSKDTPTLFYLAQTPGGPALTGISATGGKVDIDTTASANVTGVSNGVVTTQFATGYQVGDQIQFTDLSGITGDLAANTPYYVIAGASTPSGTTYTISGTADGAALQGSATAGAVEAVADDLIDVTGIAAGVVTTATPHDFANGQSITFSNLTGASGVANGTTYRVAGVTAKTFQLVPAQGGDPITDATASGGSVGTDTSVPISIASIQNGVVNTTNPSGVRAGQAIVFTNLSGENTAINAKATYYVVFDGTSDATHFSISLTPGGNVVSGADASASTAALTFSNRPRGRGMLLPTAVNIPLANKNGTSSSFSANVGFSPTRVQLAPTGIDSTTPRPVLLFTGTSTVGVKNSGFSFGVGGDDENSGKYLQLDSAGDLSLVDSGTAQKDVVVSASFGGSGRPQYQGGLDDGVFTGPIPAGMKYGDSIVFTSFDNLPPGSPLQVGVPYDVSIQGDNQLTLLGFTNVTPLYADKASLQVCVNVTNMNLGVVTTATSHGYRVGDAIVLSGFSTSDTTLKQGQTYYVMSTPSATTFTFGTSANAAQPIKANTGIAILYTPTFALGGFGVSGDVNLELTLPTQANPGTQLSLSGFVAAAFNADDKVSGNFYLELGAGDDTSTGLVINWDSTGKVTVPDWSFSISGSLSGRITADPYNATPQFTVSLSGLTFERNGDPNNDGDGAESVSVFGTVGLQIPSANINAQILLGQGKTDGIVVYTDPQGNSSLQTLDLLVELDKIGPSENTLIPSGKIQLYGVQAHFIYTDVNVNGVSDRSFTFGGSVNLALGGKDDGTGNWNPQPAIVGLTLSPGAVVIDDTGTHFNIQEGFDLHIVVSGTFKIGTDSIYLELVANGATFDLTWPTGGDLTIGISGGISLPQLGGAGVSLGAGDGSTGLTIDLDTGAWHLDGWRINIPKINLEKVVFENLTVGFTGGGDDPTNVANWDLSFAGTMKFMTFGGSPGMGVSVKLDIGEDDGKFVVNSVGAAISGLNPGIAIGDTGGFATDLGVEADNLTKADWSGAFNLGGNFGDQVSIGGKEYALIRTLVNGKFDAHSFELIGTLIFAGGIIGTMDADLDFDWSLGDYSIDVNGKFFYDAFETQMELQFTPANITALAEAQIKVPSFVPVIGGHSLASGEVYFHHSLDGETDSFLAGWGTLFGKWTDGFKHDFTTGQTTHVGAAEAKAIIANNPPETQYVATYNPTSMSSPSLADAAVLTSAVNDSTLSNMSRGLFHILWNETDPTATVSVTVGGVATQIWGPSGSTRIQPGQVIQDTTNGLDYTLSSDAVNGDIHLQVMPTDSDDPYTDLLPSSDFAVTVTVAGKSGTDPTATWYGGFSAPPPETQNFTVAPSATDALGRPLDAGARTNDIAISFDYRTTDISSLAYDFYYDYDGKGYGGTKFMTVDGSDLTVPTGNADEWTTHSFIWDVSNLPSVPTYVYAVVHDATHAPAKTDYAASSTDSAITGMVLPTSEITVGVHISGGGTTADLSDWAVSVAPALHGDVTSIVAGVVTLDAAVPFAVGQEVTFDKLLTPVDVDKGSTYYVAAIDTANNSFTFSASLDGPAIFTASAGTGDAYAYDSTATSLNGVSLGNGTAGFNPEVAGYYRTALGIKSTSYVLDSEQSGTISIAPNGDLVQYVYLETTDGQVAADYVFDRRAIIAGRVYQDVNGDGAGSRHSSDPGAGGVTVYLDDNDNSKLDPGEFSMLTNADGSYLFFPDVAEGVPYSTTIRQLLPVDFYIFDNVDVALPVTLNEQNIQSFGNDVIDIRGTRFGGTVFHDLNGNGVNDPGEPGVPNVTLDIQYGTATYAVATGADGTWSYWSTLRTPFTISAQLPAGTALTTPKQATPQWGTSQNADFAVTAPQGPTPETLNSVITSQWNPQTQTNDTYAGIRWADVANGQGGPISIMQLNGATNAGTALWTGDGQDASRYVSQIVAGSSPGINQLFGVLDTDGQRGDPITATELVQISPDGSSSVQPVNPGELFAGWNYLGTTGGLASVDQAGNVYAWSRDGGYARTSYGKVDGTPVDITTFQSGSSKSATTLESVAVLTLINGQMAVQIIDANGVRGTPINVGGALALSIASGDFNADGIEDLAVLTSTATTFYDTPDNDSYAISVPYRVTMLINDGDGDFTPQTIDEEGALVATLSYQLASRPRLTSVNVLGTNGDQLAWMTETAGLDVVSTIHIASVSRSAGEQLSINNIATRLGTTFNSSVLTAALGTNSLVAVTTFTGAYAPNAIVSTRIALNPIISNTLIIPTEQVQSGGQFGGYDFGLTGAVATSGSGVAGIVFDDFNDNGLQD